MSRSRTWGAVLGVVAVLAAGCTTVSNGQGTENVSNTVGDTTSSAATSVAASAGAIPGGLERFYQQKVDWQDCGSAQCAWMQVPVDYGRPQGDTIRLRMLKVKARNSKADGTLFVNPGGPGGSAVEYASYANAVISPPVLRRYDVVGVDPRGVGQSNPVVCLDDAQTDAYLATDPTPDDASEQAKLIRASVELGKACQTRHPELIRHISTDDVARDMDVARAVVGDTRMTLLGKSYGTFLGTVYAGLFPQNVGRFVLDGAIAPELTNNEVNLGQAEGFERATRAYVAHCVTQAGCPLGKDLEGGMTTLREFLAKLDANPLPVTNDARVKTLTEGWGVLGLAQAMYDQGYWEFLTPALRSAMVDRDGSNLFGLAREYARRLDDGRYTSNMMQVISAVNCLDRGSAPVSDAERTQLIADFSAKAPTWGRLMAWGSVTCENWPMKGTLEPKKIEAKGAAPILVIGTTRDPATPYEWAVKLANGLDSGQLLTMDGDGHTAYMRSNACIDKAVDSYLLDGKMPAANTRC